jgi:aspartokinase
MTMHNHTPRKVQAPDFIRLVRELMAPLRQVILGVSYVREKTPQVLDYVLSFGERLSALLVCLSSTRFVKLQSVI